MGNDSSVEQSDIYDSENTDIGRPIIQSPSNENSEANQLNNSIEPNQVTEVSHPIDAKYTVAKRRIFGKSQKQTLVQFNDNVKVKFIPFYYEYGTESMVSIWWSKEDYRQFHEIALKFVQMYGSLKHIEDDDKLHDEPALIIRHKECHKNVPLVHIHQEEQEQEDDDEEEVDNEEEEEGSSNEL